jgi:hypothetical protein
MKQKLIKLFLKYILKKHVFPAGVLIHRINGLVLFETEFTWYDEDLQPVLVIREVKSNKIFSIRGDEAKEFKEYSGAVANPESL